MPFDCLLKYDFEPNPDVSGKGVLTAFITTAGLTLLICVLSYLLCSSFAFPSQIDKVFLDFIWRRDDQDKSIARSRYPYPIETENVLRNAVLALSDQQIITGIAILISGYAQIKDGLSTHHWANIVNLAWLSSVSHVTTLTLLRGDLRGKKRRLWRLTGMAIMLIMLACGMASLGYYTYPTDPAWCLFHPHTWTRIASYPPYYNWIYVGCALTVIGLSYVSRVILLFPKPSNWIKNWLWKCRRVVDDYLISHHDRILEPTLPRFAQILWCLYYKICCSFYVLAVLFIDLYSSMLWEITWLGFTLAWGTVRLFRERVVIQQDYASVSQEENAWGFGQVLPIVLLVLPIISALGTMHDGKNDSSPSTHPIASPQTFSVLGQLDTCPFNLYSTPWFSKLVILQYGLSLTVLCDAIYFFSFVLGTWDLTLQRRAIVEDYSIWFAINFGIIWVFTLICADSHLHKIWFKYPPGRCLNTGTRRALAWTILIFLLISISVGYNAQNYFNISLECRIWKTGEKCQAGNLVGSHTKTK